MTFQLYSSKLKKCFDVIEKCDPPGISNSTQVDTMLSAINTSSIELRTVITNIRSDNVRFPTFLAASAEIAKHISYLFPDIKPSRDHQHRRKRHASALKGGYKGGDSRRHEKGYKIIKKNGKDYVNNVDVTDNLRTFNKKEYFKLPQAYKKMLQSLPERQKYKRPRTSENSSTTTTTPPPQALAQADIGAIVNGVMQASVAQGDTAPPTNIRMPRFGGSSTSSIQRKTAVISDTNTQASNQSNVYWDHNGQMHQR